uniref:Uncharacterized protein n=1 Tax=Starmerella bombicola TaxID=75736 RepID=B8QHP2_STABO|nr:hypothetical protein [Starmerella bombicola]
MVPVPENKGSILFKDEDQFVVTHDNILVQCRDLRKDMKVFCPACETGHYTDKFSFTIPRASVGVSSGVVVYGIRHGELSIRCFSSDDFGKYTAIVVCEFFDREMNVTKLQKVDLDFPDQLRVNAPVGFLTRGRLDPGSILHPIETKF